MTTVVYFRGVLAADRFISADPGVGSYRDKIVQTAEGFLAVCGDVTKLETLAEWLDVNSPEVECSTDDGGCYITQTGASALLVQPDGRAWVLHADATRWLELDTNHPIGIGSGAQYAVGATWAWPGNYRESAAMGVRVAAVFDPGTKVDGGVQVVELGDIEFLVDSSSQVPADAVLH